jgi:hypothetical protein
MTPLFKKLNFKDQDKILVLNAPASFDIALKEITEDTKTVKNVKNLSSIGFVIVFVLTRKQIEEAIASVFPILQDDAILWFCYPKGTSKKYTCDFNRDKGWEVLGTYNLEVVRQVAIDEDWSALRFRKTEYIKKLTRRESYALSVKGKERTKK